MNERFISERNNDTFCKLEINNNDEFLNVTRSNNDYLDSFLGIGTKQEQIPFWKYERAVLMF